MLHLYGLPPRLLFEQGGHANCKVCTFSPPILLLIVALLLFNKKFLTFCSLALILHIINARQFIFMRHATVISRVTLIVVRSDQRRRNG